MQVAFVSTVHVADDSDGENFGLGHYVSARTKRWESNSECSYGPDARCTIDSNKPFRASFNFAEKTFSYSVQLDQEGRSAHLSSVRYLGKPTKGRVGSMDNANGELQSHLVGGMTLVLSYWAGPERSDMAWLDAPCTHSEKSSWKCTDDWNEHTDWPWTCDKTFDRTPNCVYAVGSKPTAV